MARVIDLPDEYREHREDPQTGLRYPTSKAVDISDDCSAAPQGSTVLLLFTPLDEVCDVEIVQKHVNGGGRDISFRVHQIPAMVTDPSQEGNVFASLAHDLGLTPMKLLGLIQEQSPCS